jgi:hypothetical protein
MLLQPPPRPASDARLNRFTNLLDTLTDGERALEAAHRSVQQGNPVQAERLLTDFISRAQPVLEHSRDLPAEYVDLLGQSLARCLVARAGAWTEQALGPEPGTDALLRAARADVESANQLPASWLDQKTRTALTRLEHVLEPVA